MVKSARHSASRAANERALQLFPGGVNSGRRELASPLVFSKSCGAYITDVDGNRYTDFQLAFGAIILGHNHPTVTDRVRGVLDEVDLICAGSTAIEIEFAEEVIAAVPSAERLHFCNSGSEAVNHAIRLARGATGRSRVVMFHGCYHGWALPSALDRPAGLDEGPRRLADPEATVAVRPPSRGIGEQIVTIDYNDLTTVDQVFQAYGEEIAAVVVEPISHNLGAIRPQPGFLDGLRRLTADYGSVLIFDEVISGFRHALGGYQSICGIMPDVTVLAKCMANGFPVASICGSTKLMDRFSTGGGRVAFGGTFNASPVSMAAGLATVGMLKQPGTYERLHRLGEMVRSGLAEIVTDKGFPCQAAGFGSVHILYFFEGPVRNHRDIWRNDDDRDVKFRRSMIDRGFFLLPQPHRRSYLCLQHSDEDVARFLEAATDALASVYA